MAYEGALLVTLAVSIPLGTDAAVVAGTMLEVVAPGAGMLSLTPTELQTSVAKARVTCWSATEQTVSIRLCSEVTNWESPQIQAKSEILHPVAEMPASTADEAHVGIPSRPAALAKGAAKRARAAEEYFIFFFFSCFLLSVWL